jgi:pimeloyl-ACP methyl ester carboxylesterase
MNKKQISLSDSEGAFDATLLEAGQPIRVVVFAVGSGGNPERHLPLLSSLVDCGCTVIAPHFERLVSLTPTSDALLLRARRLRLALDFISDQSLPVAGVGHSIGATVLLTLAGGQLWMHPEQCLSIRPDERVKRLILLAPATGFFQAPKALEAVRVPIQVWAGSTDTITPPTQSEFLKRSLETQVRVDLRVVDGAGHFSFMDTLPPHTTEPLSNREAFLADLAANICRFVME